MVIDDTMDFGFMSTEDCDFSYEENGEIIILKNRGILIISPPYNISEYSVILANLFYMDTANGIHTHFKPLIDLIQSLPYYKSSYFAIIFYAFLILHECAHSIDYLRNGIYYDFDVDRLSVFPKQEHYIEREQRSIKYYKWLEKAKNHYNELYKKGAIGFYEFESKILHIDSLYRKIPLEKVADEYALILLNMLELKSLILRA